MAPVLNCSSCFCIDIGTSDLPVVMSMSVLFTD